MARNEIEKVKFQEKTVEESLPLIAKILLKCQEEMKDKKNSWCDKMGNIHFSKKYIPEPYIGNDNEVYLHLGDLTMKKKKKFSKLMLQGLKLLEKVA